MSAFTPGPWSINKYGDVVDPAGKDIRVQGMTLTSTETAQANARLIAAAPELLEAASTALAFLERGQAIDAETANGLVLARLRAAIAKATGAA